LFISGELIEFQGGQIGVASEAGVGSTFVFYVRARRCNAPEQAKPAAARPLNERAQSEIINAAQVSKTQGSTPSGNGTPELPPPLKHILIVEDNILNQKVLLKQLRSAGCIVSVANHGGEALAFLENSRFWSGKEATGTKTSQSS